MICCLSDTEPLIPGAPGWAGAGLLGLVLAWLMLKYLPQKDRNVKYLVDQLLEDSRAQRLANERNLERICEEFRRALEGKHNDPS